MNKHLKKLITVLIQTVERVTGFEIIVYQKNSTAAKSSIRYLYTTIRYINELTKIVPKNVFEIGANYGQDAEYLRKEFGLSDNNIYVFEPHPKLYQEIKNKYKFNSFEFAVSNKNKKTSFHAMDLSKNNGASSLNIHRYNDGKFYKDLEVQSIRMDYFISKNGIKSIDFLKIDVEGSTYNVLSGFGKFINIVKSMQVETEYVPIWKKQKTWNDIYRFLTKNNFQLIDYKLQEDGTQADSFWIQKDLVERRTYNLTGDVWKKVS